MVSETIVPLRRRLVDRRENLVARCGITFMAIEPEKHRFADSRLSDLRILSRNNTTTKARGVAHRDHRRRIEPTDLLQDTLLRQQLHLST